MVNGLDTFKTYFADYKDCYVLIGGSACDVYFTDQDLPFRVTEDLDMILYSLNKIPVKYRTKVFRTGYKLFREVMECMNVIETSKSAIKDTILERYSVAYLELRKAYRTLPVAMKEMKKGSDAEGSAFWERKEAEDAAFLRRNNLDETKICRFASQLFDELDRKGE